MDPSLFCDQVTIKTRADLSDGQGGVVAGLKPFATVPGRIEAKKQPGQRVVSAAGDVAEDMHIGYLAPALYNADGSVSWTTVVPANAHLDNGDGNDYLVMGNVNLARRHAGNVDHLEVDLRVVRGAV